MHPTIAVVTAWHDALNAGDVDRLAALVGPDIEVVGPRGTGYGAALVHEWVERAGIQLEPERVFHRGATVVVEQRATWRDAETGELGQPQTVASTFEVRDNRVRRVQRFPDLNAALTAAGLDDASEVSA